MSAYSDAVEALSPIAYWRLGEASGPTAEDETESHDGTYENGPTLGEPSLIASDPGNDAVEFAAVAREHVSVPHHVDLSLGASCTVIAWIKCSGVQNKGTPVGKINTSTWKGWQLWIDNTNGTAAGWTRNTAACFLYGDDDLRDGEPHMIVMTMASNAGKLYVDGGAEDDSGTMQTPGGNTHPLYIGERYDDGHTLTGVVDEVALFDYALSQAEIQNLYDVATTVEEATTSFKCGNCTLTFYYNPTTMLLLRVECSGLSESCECSFKAVEYEGQTWEDSFTDDGSKDCPYEMEYTSDGEGGIGNITVTIQMCKA